MSIRIASPLVPASPVYLVPSSPKRKRRSPAFVTPKRSVESTAVLSLRLAPAKAEQDWLDAVSAWENEGGAFDKPETADTASLIEREDEQILQELGVALVAHWRELPQRFKQTLFWELSKQNTRVGRQWMKERAARYLHNYGNPQS